MTDDARVYPQRPREVEPRGPADLAAGLNEAQARAATHPDGPLLVIAGAGTGKTRTLVHRVALLLERGIRPERILLLTFTRRSAQEMLARAERLVGSVSRSVHGGTFHATAHRLLRRYGEAAGLPAGFTIMDQSDAGDLMQLSRAKLGLGEKKKRFPKKETLHHVYSRHVNTEIPVAAILSEEYPQFVEFEEEFGRVFADYTARKAERNLVDYDDLLLFWAMLVETDGPLAQRISGLYDHILVDEYQDTNHLQSRILRGMCRTHANLTVVGDDAQSIYSFRGATIRNILDFPHHFPGAAIVPLEENYRSTQPILDCTNTLISRAEERYTKNLYTHRTGGEKPWLVTAHDEPAQTRFVVDRLLELHEEGVPLREMAVLFRAGYMSADLEIELTARGIPFEKWGGLKFLEAAHVKDVLAFLRVLENPRDDVSWYRLLMLMPGIGDVTARGAIDAMAQLAWSSDAFGRYQPPPRARAAHGALVELLDQLRAGPAEADGLVTHEIARVRRLYDDILRERYDRVEPRLADLDQLQTISGGYSSRAAFLSAIALEPPQATQDLGFGSGSEDDTLVLSTAHSAKGREWDAVFVIWAVDGYFPMARALGDDEQIEEERRLMYVAMTRARNHLFITYPLNVYDTRRGSDYSIDQLSRFLDRGVRETMQRVVVDAGEATPPAAEPAAPPVVDLRAMLRGRFGA
ncbi:MAG: ATP-dependent helicase [Gemmatimonadetes bacterium]|nr:ATP-dependent helicase [Gemmatimonadota bacterium]MBI3567905.1 ATP-dependent helicase [Gemmatimonadota bacterium]